MTTEDDFQKSLDDNPHDWQTRLVFADWLDDRGDPRAEGYRALGVLRLRPTACWPTWWNANEEECTSSLDADWFTATLRSREYRELRFRNGTSTAVWVDYYTRREAEDAAAFAFAKLPAARRAELLDCLSPTPRG